MNFPQVDSASHGLKLFRARARQFIDEHKHIQEIPMVSAEEPWVSENLDQVEQLFLDQYGDRPYGLSQQARSYYEMFLGEGLVRLFGGEWVYLPDTMIGATEKNTGLGIQYPHAEHLDVVSSMVPMALESKSGKWWSTIYLTTSQLLSQSQ